MAILSPGRPHGVKFCDDPMRNAFSSGWSIAMLAMMGDATVDVTDTLVFELKVLKSRYNYASFIRIRRHI